MSSLVMPSFFRRPVHGQAVGVPARLAVDEVSALGLQRQNVSLIVRAIT